jgi:hypothetical protein
MTQEQIRYALMFNLPAYVFPARPPKQVTAPQPARD